MSEIYNKGAAMKSIGLGMLSSTQNNISSGIVVKKMDINDPGDSKPINTFDKRKKNIAVKVNNKLV